MPLGNIMEVEATFIKAPATSRSREKAAVTKPARRPHSHPCSFLRVQAIV